MSGSLKATEQLMSGHRNRLRQKFLDKGISGFHDYEIIEILLTFGTPRKDCKEAAKNLIKKYKSLSGVLEQNLSELKSVKGVGDTNAFALIFVKEAAEVYLKEKIIKKDVVACSQDVFNYLFYSMRGKDIEIFKVLFLDAKNQITGTEDVHEGSIASSAVYPREIIKSALKNKASALIFAHNHPSGSINPSRSDIIITRKLVHACMHMDIKVHEHIIIGDNNYFSFADNGYIKKFVKEFSEFDKGLIYE